MNHGSVETPQKLKKVCKNVAELKRKHTGEKMTNNPRSKQEDPEEHRKKRIGRGGAPCRGKDSRGRRPKTGTGDGSRASMPEGG